VDEQGHIIMDFSIYDAKEAGFEKVIFIIKKENEESFRASIGDRMAEQMEVAYVFQELNNIPEGYEVPEGRVKPWGTGHAVLSCIDEVDGPFAVINADDYYGKDAFRSIYRFLTEHEDDSMYHYAMVGYHLMNTLTENGHVSRGVCTVDEKGRLVQIQERTHIEKRGDGAEYTEDEGKTWHPLPADALVSMNLWGFSASILQELKKGFVPFLEQGLKENPMKCEYFLPAVVSELLGNGKADAAVLESADKWYGITYKEDKPAVMAAIRQLKADGKYPEYLWK
jgi:NDP-sugar pyrophosphorylase family protein